jgi:hypothetical protein
VKLSATLSKRDGIKVNLSHFSPHLLSFTVKTKLQYAQYPRKPKSNTAQRACDLNCSSAHLTGLVSHFFGQLTTLTKKTTADADLAARSG